MYSPLFTVLLIVLSLVKAQDDCADVIGASATQSDTDGTWTFSVTVSSSYETGWDKYADAWEIRGTDGAIYGTRQLLHPHVDEQPFTRSLSAVAIPQDVTVVVIAARDSVLGYCGDEFTLELSRMESTPAPQPTAAITNVSTPAPPICEQKVCTFEFSINVQGSGSVGTIIDHTIVLGSVALIHSIEVEIASIFGEEIFIVFFPPVKNGKHEEYVPMEDERTVDGSANFDMGKVAGDTSLSNVAPYIFVEKGGLDDFTAPFSPPNVYIADTWGTGNHEAGDWNLLIFDNAFGSEFSIGNVTLTYCSSSCDAIAFPTSETPSPSSEPETTIPTTIQPQTTTPEPTTVAPSPQVTEEAPTISTSSSARPTPLPSFGPSALETSGTEVSPGSEDTMADANTSCVLRVRNSVCSLFLTLSFTCLIL